MTVFYFIGVSRVLAGSQYFSGGGRVWGQALVIHIEVLTYCCCSRHILILLFYLILNTAMFLRHWIDITI